MNERFKNHSIIALGVVLLVTASPLFAFYYLFPTLNQEIGPHQLASWISLFMGFLGFVLIIYGAARQDI